MIKTILCERRNKKTSHFFPRLQFLLKHNTLFDIFPVYTDMSGYEHKLSNENGGFIPLGLTFRTIYCSRTSTAERNEEKKNDFQEISTQYKSIKTLIAVSMN